MKPIFYRLILAFGLGSAALSAQAGYICKVDGNAVFTEKKIGNDCTESHTDGTANVSPEEAGRAVPERVDLKEALGEAAPEPGDIKVLPRTTGGSVTNTAEAANPRLDIKLRNGKLGEATSVGDLKAAKARAAELNRTAKILPAPKPQLTRKQILENEVRNEQVALVRAQAQLNVAKKKGDQAKISRLTQAVNDRQANIRAIESEMKR